MEQVRVLKFGGSSIATPELIHKVAEIIHAHYDVCGKVVVVVSAMGKGTDALVALAEQVSPDARTKHRRELDMLISVGERISMSLLTMAIRDRGVGAVSLTGSQSGIVTTESHGEAEIVEIRGERIHKNLELGKVVIVAGFQGVSREKEITTLGRGGSDTTALALAIYLNSSCARIYSDVDAFFAADPKCVPNAKKYDRMSWELGAFSSYFGAKLLHPRAALLAAQRQLEIHLLSTFNPQGNPGLLGGSVVNNAQEFQVVTINLKKGLRKLTTKSSDPLAKQDLSDLESLFPLPIRGQRVEIPEALSKMFFYSGDKNFKSQGGDKSFFQDDTEYWQLSLVGTSLATKKTLLDDLKAILANFNLEVEASSSSPFFMSLVVKNFPTTEKQLLQTLHDKFIN